jgi:hypothetical protein
VFEGRVLDATTHSPVEGVVIEAYPRGSATSQSATTGVDGRFHMEMPAGSYELSAHHHCLLLQSGVCPYRPVLGKPVLKPREVLRLDFELDSDSYPEHFSLRCPDAGGSSTMTPRESTALVVATLDQLDRDPPSIPRSERLFDHDVVYISAPTLGSGARLPRRRSRLVVKTDDELQVIANRTGASLEYLQLSRADLAGDCATVDVTLHSIVKAADYPRRCWRTRNVYAKRGGTWQFELSAPQSCP